MCRSVMGINVECLPPSVLALPCSLFLSDPTSFPKLVLLLSLSLSSRTSTLLVAFTCFVACLVFFAGHSFSILSEEHCLHFLPASNHFFLGHPTVSPSVSCLPTPTWWSSICLTVSFIEWHSPDFSV